MTTPREDKGAERYISPTTADREVVPSLTLSTHSSESKGESETDNVSDSIYTVQNKQEGDYTRN